VKWLAEHGSLEGVIAAAPSIKGVVGDNLRKALDWLPQGRRLVTVATDCDLTGHVLGWPEFEGLALGPIDVPAMLAFYDRYGFASMRKELEAATGRSGNGAASRREPRRRSTCPTACRRRRSSGTTRR
jgi:DNA polymerase-1